ncbi:MAG: helix-turn-helix domain-containing protein [Roseiarcus sp.]|jgi:excisionase family DNA binding protein
MQTNQVKAIYRRAVSVREAATSYSIGRSSLYKLIATGELRTVKVLNRRLVPIDALEALISGGGK